MKHRLLSYALALLMVQITSSVGFAATQADFPNDARIRLIEYHENDIYTIHTLYGYQTNIEFEEGEEIQTISVGDRSLWQLIPAGRRLFIRPMDENVSTNMTLITNLRAYQFDIISGKGEPKDNPKLVYVAKFIYPGTTASPYIPTSPIPAPVAVPAPALAPVALPVTPPDTATATTAVVPPPAAYVAPDAAPAPANYLYSYSGKDELAPLDTHDDGVQTYIRLANTKRIPSIYLVDTAGKKTKAKTLRSGETITVFSVSDRLMLDYGKGEHVYLYNETMNPATAP